MLVVEIAEARDRKRPNLGVESVGQRSHDAVGFLDLDRVLRRQRDDQVARELVVDVGREGELRFAETEKPRLPGLMSLLEREARDGVLGRDPATGSRRCPAVRRRSRG